MPRLKPAPPADPKPRSLTESVVALTEEVRRLADEVGVLRAAIDDFRGEYEWAVRNRAGKQAGNRHIVQLTRMAAEANGLDWKEKLNSVRTQNGPIDQQQTVETVAPADGQLW